MFADYHVHTSYSDDSEYPMEEVVKIITVGSDSHRKEHLGAYIAETLNILKTIGYKEVYTFEKMQPIPHKI